MRGGLKDMILEIVLAYNILLRLTFPRLNSGNKTGSKSLGYLEDFPCTDQGRTFSHHQILEDNNNNQIN